MKLYLAKIATLAPIGSATAQSNPFECDPLQLITLTDGFLSPRTMTIDDGYLYIHDDIAGFVIMDISDLTNPTIIAQLEEYKGYDASAIIINGDAAYITEEGERRFSIFNIEDKSDPWFRRNMPYGFDFIDGINFAKTDQYLFLESYAINISRPFAPGPDSYANDFVFDSPPIAIVGNELITETLSRYDISDPLAPVPIFESTVYSALGRLIRAEPPYYIGDSGFIRINESSRLASTAPVPTVFQGNYTIRGDIAFIANGTLDVFTTSPTPRIVQSYGPEDGMISAELVQQIGDYMIVLGDGQLAVYGIPSITEFSLKRNCA